MEWSVLIRQAASEPQRTPGYSVLMIRNEMVRASPMAGKVGSCPQRCPLQDRGQDLTHTTQAVFRLSSLSQGLGIKRVKGLLWGRQPGREKADINMAWSQKLHVEGTSQGKRRVGGLWTAEEPCSGHRFPEPALSMPLSSLLVMLSRNFSFFKQKVSSWHILVVVQCVESPTAYLRRLDSNLRSPLPRAATEWKERPDSHKLYTHSHTCTHVHKINKSKYIGKGLKGPHGAIA